MQNLHKEYYLCHGATVSKLPDEGLLFVLGPSKMHQSFVLAHRRWPVACAWTHVKCLLIPYSQKINKSIPRLHCHFIGGAAQLVCSTCKLFHAPLFTLLVRWFIIEGWAWASMHCWFNVLSCTHKPWMTAGFVTVCCSMSMVSKNFMQPFLRSTKLLRYTHAPTKCYELNV